MSELVDPRRDDVSASGFNHYKNTAVKHADDGHENLKSYIDSLDSWMKVDVTAQSTYSKAPDATNGRVYDQVENLYLDGGGIGVHRLYRRILLPMEFGRSGPAPLDGSDDSALGKFEANPWSLFVYRSASIAWLKATLLLGATPDSGVDGVDIQPAAAATWTQKTLSPADTYAAGQLLTLLLEFKTINAGRIVRIADFAPSFRQARGNV